MHGPLDLIHEGFADQITMYIAIVKPTEAGFPDHRLDESPAGYSLAGWSPPEPASASPAQDDSEGDQAV